MNKEQVKSIVLYLAKATAKKQVNWLMATDGEFQVSFPKSAVTVGYYEPGFPDLTAFNKEVAGPYLDFYNSNGAKILHLNPKSIQQFELTPNVLSVIYTHAKNHVFKYDETFEDILGGLPKQNDSDSGSLELPND